MKSRDKNGPNTDPWGTPLVMSTKLESLLWHNTASLCTYVGGVWDMTPTADSAL